jgi:hypothetical protein
LNNLRRTVFDIKWKSRASVAYALHQGHAITFGETCHHWQSCGFECRKRVIGISHQKHVFFQSELNNLLPQFFFFISAPVNLKSGIRYFLYD